MVPGDSFQSVEPILVNAPRLEPENQHWLAMAANSDETMEAYRRGSTLTRKEMRRVLVATLRNVELQSMEGQALAYLIGRMDEIDEGRSRT